MIKIKFSGLLTLILMVLVSCQNKGNNKTGLQDKLDLGCYQYNDGKNLVVMEIKGLKNGVSGDLGYSLDGKDSNRGTFSGKLENNLLFAEYTFISEGMESKREVAFKVEEGKLIEGYGELNENGTAFKDRTTIKYTSEMPLEKSSCD